MVESITRVSVHRTRVEGLIFIVPRRHKQLDMLGRVFLVFMK